MSTDAFNRCSGGMLGRPMTEYISANVGSIRFKMASTIGLIRLIGCPAGTRSSVDVVDNIANC